MDFQRCEAWMRDWKKCLKLKRISDKKCFLTLEGSLVFYCNSYYRLCLWGIICWWKLCSFCKKKDSRLKHLVKKIYLEHFWGWNMHLKHTKDIYLKPWNYWSNLGELGMHNKYLWAWILYFTLAFFPLVSLLEPKMICNPVKYWCISTPHLFFPYKLSSHKLSVRSL